MEKSLRARFQTRDGLGEVATLPWVVVAITATDRAAEVTTSSLRERALPPGMTTWEPARASVPLDSPRSWDSPAAQSPRSGSAKTATWIAIWQPLTWHENSSLALHSGLVASGPWRDRSRASQCQEPVEPGFHGREAGGGVPSQ